MSIQTSWPERVHHIEPEAACSISNQLPIMQLQYGPERNTIIGYQLFWTNSQNRESQVLEHQLAVKFKVVLSK